MDGAELFGAAVKYHQAGRLAEAEAYYRRVLSAQPSHADALHLMGVIAHQMRRDNDLALELIDKALAIKPDSVEALSNRGNALQELNRYDEALASYDKALALKPDHAEALHNRAHALQALNRIDEALASYREVLRLRPGVPVAHTELAFALLSAGRFEEGWEEHEWRWKTKQMAGEGRDFPVPLWCGEEIGDRVILLHAEQGFGDTLQFCRYVPPITAGARTILEVQAPLVRLLSRLPGITAIVARGDRLPPFDLHCPLLSLPRITGTTVETIPGETPYLAADPAMAAEWRRGLAGLGGLKVGLVWAGGARLGRPELAAIDRRRSMALDIMAPLGEASGVSFISLQTGPPAAQATHPPPGMALYDFTAHLRDFADTAALIDGLDLVISVDTAVVHLAGALGKPVWLLNRFDSCWRWLRNRDDSPWYPLLRQFRQPNAGDWTSVIFSARDALQRLAAGDRDQLRPRSDTMQRPEGGSRLVPDDRQRAAASRGFFETPKKPPVSTAAAEAATDGAELFKVAVKYHQAGKLAEAEAGYRRVLAAQPNNADALHLMGIIAHQLRHDNKLAVELIDKALALKPDLADAFNNRGNALQGLKRYEEALASYDKAVALKPDYAQAFNNRGVALQELRRLDEALASYDKALALRPDYAEAYDKRGYALHDLDRLDEALASYDKALALKPDHAEALNNRGFALHDLNRLDEALASYDKALALKPDHAEALNNRGFALHQQNRIDEAVTNYRESLRLRPNFVQAHSNLGYALLLAGRFEEGWTEHEWRWKTKRMSEQDRAFSAPLWGGEAIGDRVILLHAEQGFGDTLQFCRYVPLVAAGARTVLEVQPQLVGLLSRLPGIMEIVACGDRLPSFDLHCPLLSLPRAFGTTLETIPGETPYLAADPARAADWRRRLAGLDGLKVGLVWAGGARMKWQLLAVDRRRSMALDTMAPLGEVPGVSFISLQKGGPAAQAANPPRGMAFYDFTADLHDFEDTAALIDGLDLVISVDTAVVHLAGALGKPVWLLNRFDSCWRWLLNRDDSPWYPLLRQFRQPSAGDWTSVIRSARDALQRLAAGDRDQLRPRFEGMQSAGAGSQLAGLPAPGR